MPTDNFARKLIAAYRGTPEETIDFWDDLDSAEPDRGDHCLKENLTGGGSHMLGWCGRHTLPAGQDQEREGDPWEEWP